MITIPKTMSDSDVHLSFFLSRKSRLHALAFKMTESVSDAGYVLDDVYVSFSRQQFEQIRNPEAYRPESVPLATAWFQLPDDGILFSTYPSVLYAPPASQCEQLIKQMKANK